MRNTQRNALVMAMTYKEESEINVLANERWEEELNGIRLDRRSLRDLESVGQTRAYWPWSQGLTCPHNNACTLTS